MKKIRIKILSLAIASFFVVMAATQALYVIIAFYGYLQWWQGVVSFGLVVLCAKLIILYAKLMLEKEE